MKYRNAADVFPDELLKEIQRLDYMQEDFKDKYLKVFQKLKYSYKFWW